jgi:hypothetical protein
MSMRILLIAAIAACAGAVTAQAQEGAIPAWRADVTHLAEDRAAIGQCLEATNDDRTCLEVVQTACAGSAAVAPALRERCDLRAIAAWEDESEAIAASLRSALPAPQIAELDRAQSFWRLSLQAELGLAARTPSRETDASIRARAFAERVVYLRGRVRELTLK